jgi:hypothetical protein
MTSKTVTLHLPDFYQRSHQADAGPLSLLRAALLVVQHLVGQRCRCISPDDALRDAAELLHGKLRELLCIIDVYEKRLGERPPYPSSSNDDDLF